MGGLRNTRASSDKPTMADQWSRHPCCDESAVESGQTASSPLLWSIPFLGCPFSCLWSSLSGSPGQSSCHLLGKSSCLLSEGRSCTEDLSFALLCPHPLLSHCVFSLAHSSTLPGHALPTLPLPSRCFSIAISLFPATALWHPTYKGWSILVVDFLFSKWDEAIGKKKICFKWKYFS